MKWKLPAGICVPLALVLSQMGVPAPVQAFPAQPAVVSDDPADVTPHVINGNVNKFALIGRTMYAGGTIHTVRQQGSQVLQRRHNLMAFDAVTGELLPFAPVVNGEVWSLQPGAGGTLYVAGAFSSVNGVPARGLVRLDLATGQPVPSFDARVDGTVTDVQTVRDELVIGGRFRSAGGARRTFLASLDPETGSATGFVDVAITGRVARNSAPHVYRFSVDPAQRRMVVLGNFTSFAGAPRSRVAMLDLGPGRSTLATFDDIRFHHSCHHTMPAYFRDADWAPDGSYLVLVTTGLLGPGELCDTTSRWDDFTGNTGPTWVNKTGGDTLHSVAVVGSAIYVGGHQRYLDNPHGRNGWGPGAVARPGVGAIDPATGRALSWNPTRTRGVGAKELYPTYTDGVRGLWIGSDTEMLGREYHGSIGFFPAS